MLDQVGPPLYSCIRDFAYFIAVEFLPIFPMMLSIKFRDILTISEIYEGITDITLVLEVYGQVEKVVHPTIALIYYRK